MYTQTQTPILITAPKLALGLMLGTSLLLTSCGGDSSSDPTPVVAEVPESDPAPADNDPMTDPVTSTNVTATPSFQSEILDEDVTFAVTDTETLQLDVFGPAGDESTDRPLIILASGGGFVFEDRDIVADTAQAFAERGFIAVTMDYRVLNQDPNATAAEQATTTATGTAAFLAAQEAGTTSEDEISCAPQPKVLTLTVSMKI